MTSTRSTPFGDLLRHHRQAAGLSQAELAERAGLSVRGINDLERGVRQTPRKDTVALLIVALELVGEERTHFEAAARRSTGRAAPEASTARPPSAGQGEAIPSALAPELPLPTGTVTFLFTDIEGSTRLLQHLGAERYAILLTEHRRLLQSAIAGHGGREVDNQGDSYFTVFPTVGEALAATAAAQRTFAAHPWPDGVAVRVRMGLHTAAAQVVGDRYVGLEVHRAARIAAAGHGGQVLFSEVARTLVEDALPEGAMLRDLGTHRLKDLQRPEHLWQLLLSDVPGLPADFPPLRSLDAHPHNLPIQPTLLLGREQEVAAIVALLRENARLVTLTGAGGVGKTRLALQVAAELVDHFPDGVWFVSLSRLADPELVLPTIARTLGLQEGGSRPIAELLREYLRPRALLLLLDNYEQVAAAAHEVAEVLQTSPQLIVLATSRVALHLRGEKQVQVRPLPLPDPAHLPPPQHLVEYPAVALFVQRAQDADATFTLTNATALAITAICARVDGLPLAIELAAARLRVLPPAALLARLERQLPLLTGGARDLEARQQTMRATLAWSEQLLSPVQQRLFRRLSVFVGGFTLEAAEAVCAAPDGTEPLGLDVLEGLEALVDQSLVQPWTMDSIGQEGAGDEESGKVHFRLLFVVRDYALERLVESSEASALRRAHAAYYLRLAETVEPEMWGSVRVVSLEHLEWEHDNFRAALAWTRELGEAELGLRLAASLAGFWYVRSYYTEGRGWLEGSLTLAPQGMGIAGSVEGEPGVSAARAKALAAASLFAWVQGDNERALAAAEEALALARDQQAGWTAGVALSMLGQVAWGRGDLERASAYLEEGVARLRAAGDPALAAMYLTSLGAIALDRGDLERATTWCKENLALAQRARADFAVGIALRYLGEVARRRGDLAEAEALGREGLLVWQRLGAPAGLAVALENLALTAAAARGAQAERAARLLGAAVALSETVGAPQVLRKREETERTVVPARAALGKERWAAAYAAGQALSLEEAIAEALGEADLSLIHI
jgi:predicted ATPase/class 3 adenylate cyclase/DNA-binding XRE family transcriptional regulator